MQKVLFLAGIFLISTQTMVYGDEALRKVEKTLFDYPEQKYTLFLPEIDSPSRKYPLLCLIPVVEGRPADQYYLWDLYEIRDRAIVVSPRLSPSDYFLPPEAGRRMENIIEEVAGQFPVDRDRIYMAGFSSGADFTQKFVLQYPRFLRKAVILSPGSYAIPPDSTPEARRIDLLVGVGEQSDRLKDARFFFENLLAKEYNARLEVFPKQGDQFGPDMTRPVKQFLFNGI